VGGAPAVKVAVYDRFWPTAGGGEKVAGAIAQVLARDHDVTLLAHEEPDLDLLGERLQLDLAGVAVRVLDLTPTCVEDVGGDYDFLVNASYTSSASCSASHGLYYVHFPHPLDRQVGGLKGMVVRRLRPLVRTPGLEVVDERGLHPEEMIARHRIRWTTGEGEVVLAVPHGAPVPLHVDLLRVLPVGDPVEVRITLDDELVATTVLEPRSGRFGALVHRVTVPVGGDEHGRPRRLGVHSSSFVPSQVLRGADHRRLGVPLAGLQLGDGLRARAVRRYPSLAHRPDSRAWIESYDRILSNSQFTAAWVKRYWGVDVGVLNPPVTMQPATVAPPGPDAPGGKRPIILHVGRFFDAEHGHSKKQLELVAAFGRLVASGVSGWELHLVGGCSPDDRAYLERVRHAAANLPVVLHVDAPGAELRDLYAQASIYWHASGLGEDPDRDPDRFEHFGITTVEAMSAGAVPIVIGAAGQREVVRHGTSGYHFTSIEQLVDLTAVVIADDDLRAELGAAAAEAARTYAMDSFAERLRDVIDGIVAGDTRPDRTRPDDERPGPQIGVSPGAG
jgi:glycosyltransferase involved in cell wall biosynthesis